MKAKLTKRQTEVTQGLAAGLTLAQLAFQMDRSRETLRSHVKAAQARLGVHTQAGLVGVAYRKGLIK